MTGMMEQLSAISITFVRHEERIVRDVLRHCSICGRPTPWNPGDCCYVGTGALSEWTLIRSDQPRARFFDVHAAIFALSTSLVAVWCPDCKTGAPPANPTWWRN